MPLMLLTLITLRTIFPSYLLLPPPIIPPACQDFILTHSCEHYQPWKTSYSIIQPISLIYKLCYVSAYIHPYPFFFIHLYLLPRFWPYTSPLYTISNLSLHTSHACTYASPLHLSISFSICISYGYSYPYYMLMIYKWYL